MAHQPQTGGQPYANTYSFHGMQNVENTGEDMPMIPSEPNLAGPVPMGRPHNYETASVASETTMGPPPGYRNGGYPPHGDTGRYPQAATPWPQQGRPPANYGPAGPTDYETYAGTSHYAPSEAPPHARPRPQQRPRPQRPPHSEPTSDVNRSDSESDGDKPNTFLSCLKSGLKHIELMELVPIAGVLGASAYHYYKNRGAKHAVP
ncbi:hypothetical protein GGF47_004403, partial [Coemansia sp. RSA 2524]